MVPLVSQRQREYDYWISMLTANLVWQLPYEAWVRFVILSIISVGVYSAYGQYHASPVSSNEMIDYHRAPVEDAH